MRSRSADNPSLQQGCYAKAAPLGYTKTAIVCGCCSVLSISLNTPPPMNKKLSIAGLVVAAAASSAIAFVGSPVKAACIGGDSTCSTFDPTTISNPTLPPGALSGTALSAGDPYGFAVFRVAVTNFTGSAFNLSNFSIPAGNGITSTLTGFGDVNITGNGPFASSFVALSNTVASVDFANNSIAFTIPSGVGVGTTLSVRLSYADTASFLALQIGTSAGAFTTAAASAPSAATPSPLPIFGAASAFAASRQMRKRIKLAA